MTSKPEGVVVPLYEKREVLLSTENVCLEFDGKPVLRDVNVMIQNVVRPDMEQGQVVCLLGPSGIGKTQLFRILSGLNAPTSGNVLVGTERKPVKRGEVGVVAQHYPLFRWRTVMGNMLVAAKQGGLEGKVAQEKVLDLLSRFNLADRKNAYPAQLSGGQRQRVAIAQQMICSRHFLLMDEPFSGLDPLMKDEVCKLILQVSRMGEMNTIIITTHDISTSVIVADTIWTMGLEREPVKGEVVPGATIRGTYDLIERGLAWQPEIRKLPHYAGMVQELEDRFLQLK
ncbi:MAG: hypothetical protein A3C93_05255 [Candidatus Lloydbacteria bacterium RIFCSPHIGHO2_02_FULL_54_17]|uniref:ABC transporter domain-containing protein n=1 Tax=Candidatus Lloydbacteria bacterium RIFCSPHIGHO2_02_FULL_54_17 TaxID=1798664 RepID=A0A1G2DCF8_9BACT|nr:MAG: hypothetical protein A3C93_05255 [Candidatus Lloydbacteria bacterium RIFCSPHIGHO2_02_FULL_54_17]OGZ13807.1 MAG: hypothetical protein A2948_03890 [Candidatus Lloydbacteria bacterium RIFCSPLOWO2_01_FULL_54_18]